MWCDTLISAKKTGCKQEMAQTLKEGQLYKKGKINTEWRQRQFILNKRQLSYFKGGVSELLAIITSHSDDQHVLVSVS